MLAMIGLIVGPAVIASQAASASPSTGSISGTVTDTNQAPLASVCAYAWGLHGENTQVPGTPTDANGNYTISNLAEGNYIVLFQSCGASSSYGIEFYNGTPTGTTGYRQASVIAVTAGDATANINVEMTSAGSISGLVTDGADTPLGGVCVIATGTNGEGNTTTTANNGTYTVSGLAADHYTVEFANQAINGCGNINDYADQYYNSTTSGAPSPSTATPIAITPDAAVGAINATMGAGGSITGTITDSQGDPLSSICVEAIGSHGQVVGTPIDSDGASNTYAINNLFPDTYAVEFYDCSHNPQFPSQYFDGNLGGSPTIDAATSLVVAAGATVPSVDASMSLLFSQAIRFTSDAPTAAVIGATYNVGASGGSSGNPIIYSIDASSSPGSCSLSGTTVTFASVGTCIIDANQAGTASYAAAAPEQQKILVVTTLTSQQPLQVMYWGGQHLMVQLFSQGGSGNGSITYLVSNGTATGCVVNGTILTAATAGTCVVTATKAASSVYAPVTSSPTVITVSLTSIAAWRITGFSGILRGGKTTLITLNGTGNFIQSSVAKLRDMNFRIVKSSPSSIKMRVKVARNVKPGVYALVLKNPVGTTTKVYVVITRARHTHTTIGHLRLAR
jgi:hypothetical protein